MAKAKLAPKYRVWWIPQVPMQRFFVPVKSPDEARLILTTLAKYDLFQFQNKIKPDYCNAGGLECRHGTGLWGSGTTTRTATSTSSCEQRQPSYGN